jgi:polyisoprenoid-binding protein YceI
MLVFSIDASLGPVTQTVTGRTTGITGHSKIVEQGSAETISGSTFTADLTQLHADNALYDSAVSSALDTAHYPTSTFTQTGQVTVSRPALEAGTAVTLNGQMTFHGVARAVSFSGNAIESNGRFQVSGSANFILSDFGFTPSLGLITLGNTATLTFTLAMAR